MAYKHIEDRRAARKRWADRNKDKVRESKKRQKAAKRCHPTRQTCRIDSCVELGERHHPDNSKPKEIVWLCKQHHEEEHHRDTEKILCSINDCDREHLAKGFCRPHYKKARRDSGMAHDSA